MTSVSAGSIPAIVMAGGKARSDFIERTGYENRALLPIEGRTMLERVVAALHGAPEVAGVVVVGDVPDSPDYERIPDGGGYVENLFAGLETCRDAALAVVATADIPYLTPEAVSEAIIGGAALRVDMVYPYVAVERCYKAFPGIPRTAVHLKEGRFTGGNLVLVRPELLLGNRERVQQSYDLRKSPLKIAAKMGFATVAGMALTMILKRPFVGVPALERAVSRMVGGTAAGLLCTHPEIATDIDHVRDLDALGL